MSKKYYILIPFLVLLNFTVAISAVIIRNDSVITTFTVTIPYWTPVNDSIYLTGNIESLSNFTDPKAISMTKINEVTWSSIMRLPVGESLKYRYTRGNNETRAIRQQLGFIVLETDSARYDAVIGWEDLSSPVTPRDNYVAMTALVDFPLPFVLNYWDRDGSGSYSDLAETYLTIRDRAGLNWVGFPEAAFYTELLPLPVIKNAEDQEPPGDLSTDELNKIAGMAHDRGLKYYVHAGNPGIARNIADTLGTDNPFWWVPQNITETDTAWWDAWFEQWGNFVEPKAVAAEAAGIELFVIGAHLDYIDLDFNAPRWTALINRIRQVYSGKLTYFPLRNAEPNENWTSQLDYIGDFLWSRPEFSSNPTIDELKIGFAEAIDEIAHPKPVLCFISFTSIDGTAMGAPAPDIGEPTAHLSIDFQEQADTYEAFFQLMAEREWIAGFLTWNYAYFDDYFYFPDPNFEDDMRFTSSIRNKLAEAVTFKWRYAFDTTATVVNVSNIPDVPSDFRLFQNYPNPFNPRTTIHYKLPEESQVNITIYDILGKKVNQLLSQKQPSGAYSVKWNGIDGNGNLVSAGIYLYQIQAGDFVQTKKMVFIK